MKQPHLAELLTGLGDDELILGHRDSEWTGHAPILEEDIAFSNLAQDEVGHSLVWYTLLENHVHRTPDQMGFERDWKDFRCCRFVAYPKGDFAYTLVRQYLFDAAEIVRLRSFAESSDEGIRQASSKILPEEGYHIKHSEGMIERLGDATEESHRRMQEALSVAFPQALGMFEDLEFEERLVEEKVFAGNGRLRDEWLASVVPVLTRSSLTLPLSADGSPDCEADLGGRRGRHTSDLESAVRDLQQVYQSEPGAAW